MMEKDDQDIQRFRKNIEYRRKANKRLKSKYFDCDIFLKEIRKILSIHCNKQIIVFPSLIDWNIPLFQRPQHMAINLAAKGYLYFYGTTNHFENVNIIQQVSDNCYLVNLSNDMFENILYSELYKKNYCTYIHLYSGDLKRDYSYIQKCLDYNFKIVYEYVDEISSDISGIPIPRKISQKHVEILKNPLCYVIATSDKLYQDVLKYRSEVNCALITNGVDYNHFKKDIPQEDIPEIINNIKALNKPILGYFGALASWVDYDLIRELAKTNKYEIVLIGLNYDKSINKTDLHLYENIHFLGIIPYTDLPKYAKYFSVSIIPFLLNEVTIATSPIKLFEYMSLGKPIVTTDLPECSKYKSVMIGKHLNDFIQKIEDALIVGNDNNYKKILESEAKSNTWDEKAESLIRLITE